MKKMIIFLVIIVALFVILGVVTNLKKEEQSKGNPYGKEELHSATVDQLNDSNYQNLILPDELEQDLQEKEEMTVYFYSPECEHCKKATPKVAPLAEEMGIDLVQYNLLEFEQGWSDFRIESTPTIVHYEKGKETARLVGDHEKEDFKKWFEDHDIN